MNNRLKAAYEQYVWVKLLSLFGLMCCALLLALFSGGFPPWAWRFLIQVCGNLRALWAIQGSAVLRPLLGLILLSLALLIIWVLLVVAAVRIVYRLWLDYQEHRRFLRDLSAAEALSDQQLAEVEELNTRPVKSRPSRPSRPTGNSRRSVSRPVPARQSLALEEDEEDEEDEALALASLSRAGGMSQRRTQDLRAAVGEMPQRRTQDLRTAAGEGIQRQTQDLRSAAVGAGERRRTQDLQSAAVPRRQTQDFHSQPVPAAPRPKRLRIVPTPPAEEFVIEEVDDLAEIDRQFEQFLERERFLDDDVDNDQQEDFASVSAEAEDEPVAVSRPSRPTRPTRPTRPMGEPAAAKSSRVLLEDFADDDAHSFELVVPPLFAALSRRTAPISTAAPVPVQPASSNSESVTRINVGIGLDPGLVRKDAPNEDSVFAIQGMRVTDQHSLPAGLFIVADGMGGHVNGREASRLAVHTVSDVIVPALLRDVTGRNTSEEETLFLDLLKDGIHRANLALYRHNRNQPAMMGTTVTAVLIADTTAYVANVGDSRTYIYRPSEGLSQITRDHSVVARMVENQLITRDEIYTHPRRNQIYRCLGERSSVEIDTFVVPLQPDDVLFLCSDGLWEMVRDPFLEEIAASSQNPTQLSTLFVQSALDNGGADNISVVVVGIAEEQE